MVGAAQRAGRVEQSGRRARGITKRPGAGCSSCFHLCTRLLSDAPLALAPPQGAHVMPQRSAPVNVRLLACLRNALLGSFCAVASAEAAEVVVLTYAGTIGPISASYIARGIHEAEARGAAAVILRLDTPGGLDSSMRQIIQREMNARVPVVLFVAPRGARAASAGCLIVLAADVAAMAPGTNIGAAHPMGVSSGTVSEKVVNDAVAYARSLAAAHHRNENWAEKAVLESASLPQSEALRLNVVDLAA